MEIMHDTNVAEVLSHSLKENIETATGEQLNTCYQCGKCAAGCPLVSEMDYTPNQILRMLQLDIPELYDKVLGSYAIWLCLTCQMCYSRCPQEVNLPEIMDYLRSESLRLGKVNPKAKDIVAFHKSFLDSVKATGRLYEVGLIAGYKMRTMHLLQDIASAPSLYFKGKLKLMPSGVKNRGQISKIFKKFYNNNEGESK
jgi:heterodisulfide reductase subunit C2